jgi:hypothetical protein
MEIMDVFNQSAFTMLSLTAAVNLVPYQPNFLGSMGIFTRVPIRTEVAAIAVNDLGALQIVQTTPRGAPPIEQTNPPQSVRAFKTPRIAVADTITANELQNVIARGVMMGNNMPIVMADLQGEMAFRLDGPTGLQSKQETTKERMRLGAISGVVVDADGTVLYNWPTLFGIPMPAEIGFDLSNPTPVAGAMLTKCSQLKRQILRAAKAGNLQNIRVVALCGDDFYDKMIQHPDSRNTYLNWQEAIALRLAQPFEMFMFGGIEWWNYRGTDDNATIAIQSDRAKIIPVGVPGLFQEVLAPGETFSSLNQPGLPIYVMIVPDRDRNTNVRLETYSYPMYVATRPDVLFSLRAGA